MNNPFLFPHKQLRRAVDSAGDVYEPETLLIPDGEFSELFSFGGDNTDVKIDIEVQDGNATGDCTIHRGDTQAMANLVFYDTIPCTGNRSGFWGNGGPMDGHFTIENNSGQNVKITVKQRIN